MAVFLKKSLYFSMLNFYHNGGISLARVMYTLQGANLAVIFSPLWTQWEITEEIHTQHHELQIIITSIRKNKTFSMH